MPRSAPGGAYLVDGGLLAPFNGFNATDEGTLSPDALHGQSARLAAGRDRQPAWLYYNRPVATPNSEIYHDSYGVRAHDHHAALPPAGRH